MPSNDGQIAPPSPLTPHHSLTTHHSPFATRPGISLLEVLISILILSVGLLGMTLLVPLGHRDIVEAAKWDRTTDLGRLAFRDLQVRGYLRPDMWCDKNGNTPMQWGTPPEAFVIDPLLWSYAKANAPTPPDTFPYFPGGKKYGTASKAPDVKRLSVRAAYNAASLPGSWAPMNFDMAQRVCQLNDDVQFALPDSGKAPPAMSYSYDKNNKRMTRQFDGNYCWLVTLAPSLTEIQSDPNGGFVSTPILPSSWSTMNPPLNVSSWTARQYKVSIAICYRRNLSDYVAQLGGSSATPAERVFQAIVTTGLGGGEVRLDGNAQWLEKLKPGGWIMLSAAVPSGTGMRTWVDWYRITAVDEKTDPPSSSRYVTLHGPDWPVYNSSGILIGQFKNCYATIIDSVVGVYQKTITLDGTSPWTK